MKKQILSTIMSAILVFTLFISDGRCQAVENRAASKINVKQAVEIALNNSLRYHLAENEVEVAQTKVEQAYSAYLPKVNLSGGIAELNQMPDIVELGGKLAALNNALDTWATYMSSLTPASSYETYENAYYKALASGLNQAEGPDDSLTYYSVKLRLEQPLYTGGKLTAINNQAKANLEYAKANLNVAEANLVLDVKKAYYGVLQVERLLDTLNQAVAAMENHRREAELYCQAGMVSKLDVMRAEVKLADLKQKQLTAQNALGLASTYLNFVLGVPLDTKYRLEDATLYKPVTLSLEACQKTALEKRDEMKTVQTKVTLAEEAVKIVESANKPLVAFVIDGDHTSTDLFEDTPDWSFSLVASMKLYDGGTVKNQIAESKVVVDQAKTAVELTSQAIQLEVEQAYRNLQNAVAAIDVSHQALGQAEETARMADVSYQAGLCTSLERIDAEIGLTQAKNNYTQALNDYYLAVAQLEKALGVSKEELQ